VQRWCAWASGMCLADVPFHLAPFSVGAGHLLICERQLSRTEQAFATRQRRRPPRRVGLQPAIHCGLPRRVGVGRRSGRCGGRLLRLSLLRLSLAGYHPRRSRPLRRRSRSLGRGTRRAAAKPGLGWTSHHVLLGLALLRSQRGLLRRVLEAHGAPGRESAANLGARAEWRDGGGGRGLSGGGGGGGGGSRVGWGSSCGAPTPPRGTTLSISCRVCCQGAINACLRCKLRAALPGSGVWGQVKIHGSE
jgi:hypothetical protein